jgi:carboxypeptidase Taq
MGESTKKLLERLALIGNLRRAGAVLEWDMQTYMPPGAAEARGEQMAAVVEIAHKMSTSEETGRLLEAAEQENAGSDPNGDASRLLSNARYDFDRQTKIPADLAAEMTRHSAVSQAAWQMARAENDFASFAPFLEKTFEMERQAADLYGWEVERYDALLNLFERGAKTTEVSAMFAELKPHLVELTRAIAESPRRSDAVPIRGRFPTTEQNALTLDVVQKLGYDLEHGRQDVAAHPFCTSFSRWDVRITTRFDENELGPAFYASLHEAGHGLYEQGMPADHDNDPIGDSASSGVHESQSRMWENLVGRSRAFAEFITPTLKRAFPDQLADLTVDRYYRAVNRVEPSLIRVEADEVTYNLHVLLRFELERALLEGELAVKDLPDAWNAKMKEYIGIEPPNDSDGVLQDVHWSGGLIGYFPTYSIGNVMSGQLWHAIGAQIPDLEDRIRRGGFAQLLGWLRTNVHEQGRRYLPNELIERATGEPLTARYYLEYLKAKYNDLYELGV